MTTRFSRPAGAHAGASSLANRTKYQDDAAAVPKRAISSAKIDGDFNYLVDSLNETWDALTHTAFSTALPAQAGEGGKVPVTNGTTTSWQQIGNANVADGALALGKLAPVTGSRLIGSSGAGAIETITPGEGLSLAGGVLSAALPAGVVLPLACASVPSGWLLCSGSAVSRTTYAGLFAAIGTLYGAGDGSTTFNLPDLRGRAVFGKDDMGGTSAARVTSAVSGISGTTLGGAGGSQAMQQHNHSTTVTDPGHSHATVWANSGTVGTGGGNMTAYSTGTQPTASTVTGIGVAVNNAGSGTSQNMPPAMVMNWIIKA